MENSVLVILLVSSMCVVPQVQAERLCLTGSFDHQVATLLSRIRLSEERLGNISQIPSDLERMFQHHWPGCKVLRFGSTITLLALQSSDIDCFVDIPGDDKGNPQTLLAEATAILKNHPDMFENFVFKQTVRVPLLTCKHIPTNISVDITVSGPFAVNSSRLLSHLLHIDQRGLQLAMILKYWGTVHDIANGKLTLPSYAMTLMAVFYLQQRNIIPSVVALQQNVTPYEVEHWNTAFQHIGHHTDNNETLYELLGGFFTYYSDFDFRNTVISPYVGYPIKREDFDKLPNFDVYKRNLANGYTKPFPFGYLNIQDSLRHSENAVRHYDVQWPALRLVRYVRAAARMYKELSSEEFLTAVLVPEKRKETGRLTTFWGDGVIGSPAGCMPRRENN